MLFPGLPMSVRREPVLTLTLPSTSINKPMLKLKERTAVAVECSTRGVKGGIMDIHLDQLRKKEIIDFHM